MSDTQLLSPEDCPIPEEVRTAARMGKLAFFVGNGISRLYGLPSWDELATKMLSALADHGIIDHNKVALLSKCALKERVSIADYYLKNADVASKGLTYAKIRELVKLLLDDYSKLDAEPIPITSDQSMVLRKFCFELMLREARTPGGK